MTATGLTTELRSHHGQHVSLLRQVRDGHLDVADLPQLLPKVVLETVRHVVQEEVLLVPVVRERLGEETARDCLDRLGRIEAGCRALESTGADDPALPEVIARLEQDYDEHVRWQESELFPGVEAAMREEEVQDAGEAVNPTREVGPTGSHPIGFHPVQRGWPAPGLVDELREALVADATRRLGS